MSYTITITNTYKQASTQSAQGAISPAMTYIPSSGLEDYISDAIRKDGGFVSIPLYKRGQFANIPPNSILTLYTDNSNEAIYYQELKLENGSIAVTTEGDSEAELYKKMFRTMIYRYGSKSPIIFPEDITSIGPSAFADFDDLRLKLNSGLLEISTEAFRTATILGDLEIPSSVTTLFTAAFEGTRIKGNLKFLGTEPPRSLMAFSYGNFSIEGKILVPRGSLSAYTSASDYPDPSRYTYEEYDPE